ncbi:hypothetical protein CGMCC3_g3963 [Colletotrichum fructicola]|nr:uncharacterized protein CGMCC3_g3963 [Colletotrichum fructicola]KAE9580196.1 hypothetical protein CGMCC3_g3963 [Colletotrichum fructicola]
MTDTCFNLVYDTYIRGWFQCYGPSNQCRPRRPRTHSASGKSRGPGQFSASQHQAEVCITLNLPSTGFELLHIPVGEDKFPIQESRFLAGGPDEKV